jgi:hypothetical protein
MFRIVQPGEGSSKTFLIDRHEPPTIRQPVNSRDRERIDDETQGGLRCDVERVAQCGANDHRGVALLLRHPTDELQGILVAGVGRHRHQLAMDSLQFLRRVVIFDDGDVAAERTEGMVAGFQACRSLPRVFLCDPKGGHRSEAQSQIELE